MSQKRKYAVGCYTPEDWQYIHELLLKDGTLEDNIPNESITCYDLKEHSETRAVYLLSEEEANDLLNHPRVKFINLDYSSYPKQFKPPPEELQSTNLRYNEPEKQYRNWFDTDILPVTPNSTDLNRSGYQILRCAQIEDPWYGIPDTTVIQDRISYLGDGSDVDVIVGDEGCWIGHVEFQRNTGYGPINYRGGNVLPGNGTCDLLDLVLDAPYYIDPDWFNASPSTRLTTRWDGTIVPVESVARSWWGDGAQRSSQFASIGTVIVTSSYTRAACLGSNSARPTITTTHGTQCSALTYGRTQGWAFNANKWVVNAYGTNGSDIEQYFDMMKLFHLHKPINPNYGTKDPTISSNSWGYRATQGTTGWYYYRVGTSGSGGIQYSSKPPFMQYIGVYGDGNRMKGEHPDNSYTIAGKEMIDAGVIFVVAAGNSNQKQVEPDHPDFNNYWASAANTPLTSATHAEFGITAYNTVNRRGFPQQLGKYNDQITGRVTYPAINIGALDDSYMANGKERKVNYSDMGNSIDCYAPADGTLSAVNATSGELRPDTYTAGSTNPTDSGVTGICNASTTLTGTSSFNVFPNRSFTIRTTSNTVGTATSLTNLLLGPLSLTSSTTPTVGNNDDGYWTLTLPFNVEFAGITTNVVYPGTNTYITFTAGSSSYSALSFSNPAVPKIMMSCADNSCQRLYYGVEGISPVRTYRIRYEGTSSTSGTLGAPNMVYEAIFYENDPNRIDFHVGSNAKIVSGTTISAFYDGKFSGTSAACPVACGLIATKLQYNRSWGWQDVRNWLRNNVGIANTNEFYTGVESTTATSSNWADVNSIEGGDPIVIWDAPTNNEPPIVNTPIEIINFARGEGLKMSGIVIKYR